jgi:hypothetical protein
MAPGEFTHSAAGVRWRPRRQARVPRLPLPDRLPRLVPELALLVTVYAIYKYGRKVANGHTGPAFHHARQVWSFERWAHLPSERSLQRLMVHWEPVIHTANYLYATVHFPAMLLFLGWMFLRHRAHYLWIRRAIVIQTMLALLGHLFYPLAPPRMLAGSGMIDTARVYGPAVYQDKPDGHSMANQFAAMPSLHVGWALAIAVGLIASSRTRWRRLWLLHPLVMLAVVVGTANHYWLDAIVGSALLALALAVIPGPPPLEPSRTGPDRRTRLPATPPRSRHHPRARATTARPTTPRGKFNTGPSDSTDTTRGPSPEVVEGEGNRSPTGRRADRRHPS